MGRTERRTIIESAAYIGFASLTSALMVLGRMESPPRIYDSVQTNEKTFQLNMQDGNFGWININHMYANFKTGCVPELEIVKGKLRFQMFVMNHSFSLRRGHSAFDIDYMRNTSIRPWEPKTNNLSEPFACVLESSYSPISTILQIGRLEQKYYGTSRLLTALAVY